MDKKEREKRKQEDEPIFNVITIKDLICNDCVNKYDDNIIKGNVSRCEIYKIRKPSKLFNENICNFYKKI